MSPEQTPLIRQALHSPAGNNYTERGADLAKLADAGDLAVSEDAANARVMIQAGIELSLKNRFQPIALGGDHSITYPIMRAIAQAHHKVTILHIDAHGDLWPDDPGRIDHGTMMGRAIREGLVDAARSTQVNGYEYRRR